MTGAEVIKFELTRCLTGWKLSDVFAFGLLSRIKFRQNAFTRFLEYTQTFAYPNSVHRSFLVRLVSSWSSWCLWSSGFFWSFRSWSKLTPNRKSSSHTNRIEKADLFQFSICCIKIKERISYFHDACFFFSLFKYSPNTVWKCYNSPLDISTLILTVT